MILNPLGVPSRMNLGQILETHLGWVALNGWYEADNERGKNATRRAVAAMVSTAPAEGVPVSTPVFDGAAVKGVDHALVEWEKEHIANGGRVRMDVDEKRRVGEQATGKVQLFNGRNR